MVQATLIETPPAAAAHSSEGLLNLLLLADSSLHDTSSEEAESASEQDCNDSEQESGSEHDDDSKQDGDSYRQTASGTHDQEPIHTSADAAFNKRPTAAGRVSNTVDMYSYQHVICMVWFGKPCFDVAATQCHVSWLTSCPVWRRF